MSEYNYYRRKKPTYLAARLLPGTLARFLTGLRWDEILRIDPSLDPVWWSNAVGAAEDDKLLWWDRANRCWWLSDAGRELVREVA